MARKLGRLPERTRDALGQLACLGTVADMATLGRVSGVSDADLHAGLWDAVRAGLVLRQGGNYAFLHDRVQEAAYATDPGRRARRRTLADRKVACVTDASGRDGRGDLRYRQPPQSRRGPDRGAGRAFEGRRAQPRRRPARKACDRLCVGADVPHRRPGAAAGGALGPELFARLHAGTGACGV